MAVTTPAPAPRPKRADARRNRERVIAAAAAVFAEKGLEAGIPEIAARAGVGKATIYRSFPSKDHLVAAVALDRLRWFERLVQDALEEADAAAAFAGVLHAAAARQCGDQAVAGAMASTIDVPEVTAARTELAASLDRLIHRAQAQGGIRGDVTWNDVKVLFAGVTSVLRHAGERDEVVWRRYVGLVLDALRP